MIITRSSALPGFLAPRVAFDVAEERVAEQSILQQERVEIGYGWIWDRPRNLLLHLSQWTEAVPRASGQLRLHTRAEQFPGCSFDDWLDGALLRFTSVKFS